MLEQGGGNLEGATFCTAVVCTTGNDIQTKATFRLESWGRSSKAVTHRELQFFDLQAR